MLAAFFPSAGPQLRAWAEEAAVSRFYGGIHFPSDNEAGLVLGRKVGGAAIAQYDVRPLGAPTTREEQEGGARPARSRER